MAAGAILPSLYHTNGRGGREKNRENVSFPGERGENVRALALQGAGGVLH